MLAALLIMALVSPVTSPANEQTLMVRGVDVDECVDVSAGGGGGSPEVWYEQNWDYADTTAMKADAHDVVEDNGTVTLQTTGVEGGLSSVNKALRATYSTTVQSTAELGSLPPDYNVDDPRELWIEVYLRFNASWNTQTDDKTFFYMEDRGGEEVARWETHIVTAGPGGYWFGGPSERLNPPVSAADYFRNEDVSVDPWDGAWHRFRQHYKMSSTETATDGKYRVWWDDTVIFNQTSIATNSPSTAFFHSFRLGANADPNGSGIRDWGRVRIYISDPGW